MLYKTANKFTIVFLLLVLADTMGVLLALTPLHYIIKPLLMPSLMLVLWLNDADKKGKGLLLAGLFFSWMGDVFLLFETVNKLFFIAGLISFLLTHVCYITYFLSVRSSSPSLIIKQPLLALAVPLYGFALVWILYPSLGALKMPVIIYAIIICTMLFCSLHIYLKVNTPSNRLFVGGAALFVISDSLLAVNKFYRSLPLAPTLIMLTYCAAQFYIVAGFSRQKS